MNRSSLPSEAIALAYLENESPNDTILSTLKEENLKLRDLRVGQKGAQLPPQQHINVPTRSKRQRILIDDQKYARITTRAGPETEYEKQRADRIAKNKEVLQQMQLAELAAHVVTTATVPSDRPGTGSMSAPTRHRPHKRHKLESRPMRKSARTRGIDPDSATVEISDAPEDSVMPALLEPEDYFKLAGVDISRAIRTDGHYRGWVENGVRERCCIASCANAAWEQGGRGRFSQKMEKKSLPAHLKAKGWSDARVHAATQLKNNPNTYFYRHVEQGQQQAHNEWTEEEHQAFLETARQFGVGDRWGLFSTFVPQRVGYQCSAYYRDVVLPSGLVIDPRFKFSREGKAHFVG